MRCWVDQLNYLCCLSLRFLSNLRFLLGYNLFICFHISQPDTDVLSLLQKKTLTCLQVWALFYTIQGPRPKGRKYQIFEN